MEEKIKEAQKLLVEHGRAGQWDRSEYNHGMYNGMELILSVMEGRKPKFRPPPDVFTQLEENKNYDKH